VAITGLTPLLFMFLVYKCENELIYFYRLISLFLLLIVMIREGSVFYA